MANKFTKSVLERQYLEKQRSGPQRGRERRTEDSEKDEPLNLESTGSQRGLDSRTEDSGKGNLIAPESTGPQRGRERRAEDSGKGNLIAPESTGLKRGLDSQTADSEKDMPGAVASGRSGSASDETPLTIAPNPQGGITIEGASAGAAQGSVPEHIIPNPQGRDGNELAAGIDEAFTRADGGQEGLQNAREKGEGLDSTAAPDSTEAGSEVSAFTRNVTTTTETEPQNNQINAGPGGDFSPQRGAGQSPKMVRSEPPKGSAETSEPTAATSVANTGGMGNAMPDLVSSYLIRTPERIAKNKTFYLDEAVINAIRTAAKKQKVTESKLVNDILGGVLGIR